MYIYIYIYIYMYMYVGYTCTAPFSCFVVLFRG